MFTVEIFIFAVLVVLSALFSASESAYLSLNRVKLLHQCEKKNRGALRVSELLKRKTQLLNTLLICNNLVNICAVSVASAIGIKVAGAKGALAFTLATTIFFIVFCELLPKLLGVRHSLIITGLFSLPIKISFLIFFPLSRFLDNISMAVLHLLRIPSEEHGVSFTESEIRSIIDLGAKEGSLKNTQKDMLHRTFRFADLKAKDIMIPRRNIVACNKNISLRDLLELSEKTHRTQFPVFDDDIDSICGVISVKDILFAEQDSPVTVPQQVMKEAILVPETMEIQEIRNILVDKNQSMAIVLDEYSGTQGLLTLEDISKEIFHVISPEREDDLKILSRLKDDCSEITLDGNTRLDDINEMLETSFHCESGETLAGFLLEHFDSMAKTSMSLKISGWIFTVKSATQTRIVNVGIKRDSNG